MSWGSVCFSPRRGAWPMGARRAHVPLQPAVAPCERPAAAAARRRARPAAEIPRRDLVPARRRGERQAAPHQRRRLRVHRALRRPGLGERALEPAARALRRRPLANPLAFSLPPFDPPALLARGEPYALRLFHPAVALACAVLVVAAAFGAALNWEALRAHAATHLATGYYLGLVWATYPVGKLLHELAHALAVRRWGGEVRQFGVTFLFFTPAPYMDASAAGAFSSRWRRAAVSLAGIGVELAIGAAALLAWLALERGVLSDVAFVLLAVCLGSSVLFNANPLLRFDGYHALCDLVDSPNLALRS